MFQKTQKKAADLIIELRKDVKVLEAELAHKKQLLDTLAQLERRGPMPVKTSAGRPKAVSTPTVRKAGGKRTGRRQSKNRDAILAAANKLDAKNFTLAELIGAIHEDNPKFGGSYPSGTVLAALKTTPEVKKVKRGLYALRARRTSKKK